MILLGIRCDAIDRRYPLSRASNSDLVFFRHFQQSIINARPFSQSYLLRGNDVLTINGSRFY